MKRLLSRLQQLDLRAWRLLLPSWQAMAIAGGTVVVLGAAGVAAALWFAAEHHRGLEAFAEAMVKLRMSQAPNASPEAREQAARDLEATLSRTPSASISAQVTYELGNLKYSARQYSASRSAYELTAGGASSPTLRRLAQISVGYTWEVEKDYPKAIAALEKALSPLKPDDFLHDDLLMDLGRAQELAGRKDDAIKTYQRVVANAKSLRSDDARGRLANLGAQS